MGIHQAAKGWSTLHHAGHPTQRKTRYRLGGWGAADLAFAGRIEGFLAEINEAIAA